MGERWEAPVLERLQDAAMVLATAPLRMDREAGQALSQDCEDGAAEIRRLTEENKWVRMVHAITLKSLGRVMAEPDRYGVTLASLREENERLREENEKLVEKLRATSAALVQARNKEAENE